MENINQFMWGYQKHYWVSINSLAERIFNQICPGLFDKVFLVGILNNGEQDKPHICFEPEEYVHYQNLFNNVNELSSQLEAVSPEKNIILSIPEAQENHDRKIRAWARRDAIIKCVEKNDYFKEFKTYASVPVIIEKYSVFIVLQLNYNVYNSFYKLKRTTIDIGQYNIPTSIIDTLSANYFDAIITALKVHTSGSSILQINEDDLIKKSGSDFMYSVSSKGENYSGISGLFERLNIISSLKYENKDIKGNMIICKKDHDNIKLDLTFLEPIEMDNYRKVRKIIELSSEKKCLISDSNLIYGLGHLIGEYNPINEDLFVINFTGHYQWELKHDKKNLLKVKYNQPFLPSAVFNRNNFFSDMKRIFKSIEEDDIISLYHVIISIISEKKGAILVICKDAKEEAIRLKYQSMLIKPMIINDENIKKICSIDGAVLIDFKCVCYSIGTILDGLSTSKGDSARGSRYNSSIRYYENKKDSTEIAVVIVSEDGMVDFIPKLKPRIKKTLINDLINNFIDLNKQNKIEAKKFYALMNKINKYSFYFNIDQCAIINKTRKEIEEKGFENIHGNCVQVIHEDINPHQDFNESYLE